MSNPSRKEAIAIYGLLLTGFGYYIKRFSSSGYFLSFLDLDTGADLEQVSRSAFPSYFEKVFYDYQTGQITSLEGVERIRRYQEMTRYLSVACFALLALAVSVEPDTNSDGRLGLQSVLVGSGIALYLSKTGVERLAEDVIEFEKNKVLSHHKLSFLLEPSISDVRLGMYYSF